jgi:hypothetical protein
VEVALFEPLRRAAYRPALEALLTEAGCRVELAGDRSALPGPDSVLLIRGGYGFFPRTVERLVAMPANRRPLVAVWHMEPLLPPRSSGHRRPAPTRLDLKKLLRPNARVLSPISNYLTLRRLARLGIPDLLVVSTPGPQEFLAERGISAHWIPVGYEPNLGRDLGLERDIDALFLGSTLPLRRRRLIRQLKARGVPLLVAGAYGPAGVWGEERTELVNRTKILVDLPRLPGMLTGIRMAIGMSNGALVVSEPLYAPAPFVPGTHFVSTPLEEMPATIRYYLEHEDERRQIAAAGQRLVTEEITMRRSVGQLLELLREALHRRSGDRAG